MAAARKHSFLRLNGNLDATELRSSSVSTRQTNVREVVEVDLEGAIPSNLLQIPNTESNSSYLRHCSTVGVKPHPARFPEKLPWFFIEFLTDPGDTVLDIFVGSNTTGSAAETLGRHWIAFEKDRAHLAASVFRFIDELSAQELAALWIRLHSAELPVAVNRQQREMLLMDEPLSYAGKKRRQPATKLTRP